MLTEFPSLGPACAVRSIRALSVSLLWVPKDQETKIQLPNWRPIWHVHNVHQKPQLLYQVPQKLLRPGSCSITLAERNE